MPDIGNWCWPSPAQSFLVSGPVGTPGHIFLSHLTCLSYALNVTSFHTHWSQKPYYRSLFPVIYSSGLTPSGMVGGYQRFWGNCCVHIQGIICTLKIEVMRSYQTLVNNYQAQTGKYLWYLRTNVHIPSLNGSLLIVTKQKIKDFARPPFCCPTELSIKKYFFRISIPSRIRGS
jgi:hypothetical protein